MTERTRTASTPDATTTAQSSSVSSSPASAIFLLPTLTSSARTRPKMLVSMCAAFTAVPSGRMTFTWTGMLRSEPQSSSRMISSCATSTRRRVRYPESAVRSAVSASPLRAPCVEMKYSSTDRPSRKFDLIGRGMISPFGLATRPRIPAS